MIKIKNFNLFLPHSNFSLREINLEISPGEFFVLLGPTGSGKTLLLESLVGFHFPTSGQIYLAGEEITFAPPEKRNIGFVPQDCALFPHLNVKENICFGLKMKKKPSSEIQNQLREISELLQIKNLLSRFPKNLSGGEKQKVALARSLIIAPKILILDEPLSSLDVKVKAEFQKLLAEIHCRLSVTVLYVTHSFEEAISLGERVGVINQGRIVQVDETLNIFQKPTSSFVADFVGGHNIFKGKICEENGQKKIDLGQVQLFLVTDKVGEANVSLRPEDILVSLRKIESSARNCLKGKIIEITDRGQLIQLKVKAGPVFTVLITRASFEEMKLTLGKSVYLTFKTTSLNVFG